MTQTIQKDVNVKQEIKQQAGKILTQVAGYIGTRTMELGLRLGLFKEIAKHTQGITTEALAKELELDPFYVQVWCNSAYAAELLELNNDLTYGLSPYVDKLLLDKDFPGYIGGLPTVFMQPEVFDKFAKNLPSGDQIWWDKVDPAFIQAVVGTTRPFYLRLIPGGLTQVPGLSDKLAQGGHILELASGAGDGLVRMAQTYPQCSYVGVDGDAHSLEVAAENLRQAGVQDKVSLKQIWLEELNDNEKYDIIFINTTMHECRDIDKVTQNVLRALKPGGFFVISDFPFPNSTEELRTVPARIMTGVQFFEALIGDQLLPTQDYIDLLNKHGFRNVGAIDLSPVHAVTYGQK